MKSFWTNYLILVFTSLKFTSKLQLCVVAFDLSNYLVKKCLKV